MTWRWLICFSLGLGAGVRRRSLTGSVVLRDSRETAVRKGGDFSGVVVSLVPVDGAATRCPLRSTRAWMLQKDKTFTAACAAGPGRHAQSISRTSIRSFITRSPATAARFSMSACIRRARAVRCVSRRPGVVRVFCNIHPSMSAVIVVLNTPYFATTDRSGRFKIKAPPGDYELHVFHERATEPHAR